MAQASIWNPPKWTPVDFNVIRQEKPCSDFTGTDLSLFCVFFAVSRLGLPYFTVDDESLLGEFHKVTGWLLSGPVLSLTLSLASLESLWLIVLLKYDLWMIRQNWTWVHFYFHLFVLKDLFCVSFFCMYIWGELLCLVSTEARRVLGLQSLLNYHSRHLFATMSAGNQVWVIYKSNKCSYLLTYLINLWVFVG